MVSYTYKQKPDYVINKNLINSIMNQLNAFSNKTILYMGYSDKNLCITLHKKYAQKALFWDWFDRTNLSIHEWDGEDKEFCARFPVPKWAKELSFVLGTGVPPHEILLIDIPIEFDFEEAINNKPYKLAEMILLFGEADTSYLPTRYKWSMNGSLLIGKLIG